MKKIQETIEVVKRNLVKAQIQQKKNADVKRREHTLKVGADQKFLLRSSKPPPEPEIQGDYTVEYEVEKIVYHRKWYGKMQFRVRWKGYGPEEIHGSLLPLSDTPSES